MKGTTKGQEIVREYEAGERDFGREVLSEADLSGADLFEANLSGADLRRASLCNFQVHPAARDLDK